MNLILFPITVGLLYEYVTDNIDEEEREILDSCIMQFLVSLESSDYRSMREGANMVQANVVIANCPVLAGFQKRRCAVRARYWMD